MKTERYQGWTNYETWNVALWIGNEEGSYTYWQKEQAEECYRSAVEADPDDGREEWTEDAAYELARRLKDEFEDHNPLADKASVYGDLLTAALGEVDWHEIALSYVEELDRDAIEAEVRADA